MNQSHSMNSSERQAVRKANEERTVKFPDGTQVPAIGQGTWRMGERPGEKEKEVKALQLGLELGMTLLDTAEMYGEGGAEEVTGEAIRGIRDQVFLVSKVYPHHAGRKSLRKACENSLQRLGTDYLDLYLLHWRGNIPLQETVDGMEELRKEGKIARWGVSNFDTDEMKELWACDGGSRCATNQVLYHLGSRGIEYDLLPWMRKEGIPLMAYCPIAQGGLLRQELTTHPTVQSIADAHDVSPIQLILAWSIRNGDVIAIPKAVQQNHVLDNAKAASIRLSEKQLAQLDQAFPPPDRKVGLDIV
ncbi:aldo/keto reductase [Paenibacillus senegalensis]|uniref:aldo/keto reductase n=1 Tax=Paenibacillus senegalensis TaxID=1465766 RepID=UPI000287CD7F|nr:aldo/keto reductase [Paenibacillus senegalensis]